MLQKVSSNPHAFKVFCDDVVTWAGFPGITNVRTTCNTKWRKEEQIWGIEQWQFVISCLCIYNKLV
jgi:hypothetical protein